MDDGLDGVPAPPKLKAAPPVDAALPTGVPKDGVLLLLARPPLGLPKEKTPAAGWAGNVLLVVVAAGPPTVLLEPKGEGAPNGLLLGALSPKENVVGSAAAEDDGLAGVAAGVEVEGVPPPN